jgi:hypothetical protein
MLPNSILEIHLHLINLLSLHLPNAAVSTFLILFWIDKIPFSNLSILIIQN